MLCNYDYAQKKKATLFLNNKRVTQGEMSINGFL